MGTMRAVRTVASVTLAGASGVLGMAGKIVGRAAEAVRPADGASAAARGVVREPVQPRSQESVPGIATARVGETHVEEMADLPASEVVARVPELSTDELRLLLEHEQAGRRRKTVIEAIEQAAAEHTV